MDSNNSKKDRIKKPTTFVEQVNILKNRNLQIEDEEQAIETLSRINYYRLSAYMLSFKVGNRFHDGVSFNDVYEHTRMESTEVQEDLGKEKKVFPNVDFYSGMVYKSLGIESEYYTPIFAVSRVSGWTAHVIEYLKKNRISRPRAIYVGDYLNEFIPH